MSSNTLIKVLLVVAILNVSGILFAQNEPLPKSDSLELANVTSNFNLSEHYTPDIKTVILQTETIDEADNALADYLMTSSLLSPIR